MKDFKEKVLKHVRKPYFKNMEYLGLYPNEKEYVLSKIFNQPVKIYGNYIYDINGNRIYFERSYGYWEKWEYDINGKLIYYERSDGSWGKWEYDTNGNQTYFENSDGYWEKSEYNDNGNEIYFENSDGEIIDNR